MNNNMNIDNLYLTEKNKSVMDVLKNECYISEEGNHGRF